MGKYIGSATSGQAGPLDIALNLLFDRTSYAGSLNTPMGVYTVTAGSSGPVKLHRAVDVVTPAPRRSHRIAERNGPHLLVVLPEGNPRVARSSDNSKKLD